MKINKTNGLIFIIGFILGILAFSLPFLSQFLLITTLNVFFGGLSLGKWGIILAGIWSGFVLNVYYVVINFIRKIVTK